MKSLTQKALILAVSASTAQLSFGADSITEALKESTPTGNFNLRYEDVERGAAESDGLTLRSRIGLKTGTYENFSAVVEFEDVRDVLGIDDRGGFIADEEVTELEQAFIQYKTDAVTAKVGRQVIALDGQRFIGHVGWRQDRQTFDAARLSFAPAEGATVDLGYIYQRNRIFGERLDAASSDFFLNGSYKTSIGKLVGYAYLLDQDSGAESDTYGLSLTGSTSGDTSFLYHVEYATQDIKTSGDASPDYIFAEVGVKASGITAKLGYEVLGADGTSSFTTPLATLFKFNGWIDTFLVDTFQGDIEGGLEDTYISLAGNVAGIALTATYHDFSQETSTANGDFGTEFGLKATKAFKGGYTLGAQYASFDSDSAAYGDQDKLWLWASYSF